MGRRHDGAALGRTEPGRHAPRAGAREPADHRARVPVDQGVPRVWPRLRRQGVGRRGARDGDHAARADAGFVRRRVVVGAAGMVVELFIATLALYLWLQMEPGLLRAILFNVMLIAGVSTVL